MWTHSIDTFVDARRILDILLSVKSWNSLIICRKRIHKRVRLYRLGWIETYGTQQTENVSHNIDSLLIFGIWNILEKIQVSLLLDKRAEFVKELNKLCCTKYDDKACILVYCLRVRSMVHLDCRAVFWLYWVYS
jgi:hypothetical protein